MPILFVSYLLAYLDRVNVGFAKLQMQHDLQMSDAVYGMGAGIFFIGYFAFEVPANMLLQRTGARIWLGCIMVGWGMVSASTMFVRTADVFYILRFFLGVVEAGFFPGVILYLTFWYPRGRRAKMVAVFMTAIPLSGAVGGAVSGWILAKMSVFGGLHGWQWLYLIEGLPSVAAGLTAMALLQDHPGKAKWLAPPEKELLISQLKQEEEIRPLDRRHLRTVAEAFRSAEVWILCAAFFGFAMGSYGVGFWLPQIIHDTVTRDPWHIGLLSTVPWSAGAIAMVLAGHHSDRTGERRWHIVIAGLIGASAFAVSAIPGISGALGLTALTVATGGIMVTISLFWTLPTAILSSTAAAAGIAWINSIGSLAGYFSPFIVGRVHDATHSMTPALLILAASALIAAVIVAIFSPSRVNPPPYSAVEVDASTAAMLDNINLRNTNA
jgi:MFS family permease